MVGMNLDAVALRVLGSLMEKEMTTPESYPLSLNGLISAANQKTSRDPVMDLSEDDVRSALDVLQANDLVSSSRDARVPKYENRIRTVLNLRRDETAVLCLLLLRGPQTAGELRTRSDRTHQFDDLPSVQATLDRMAGREKPLARALPRVPGSRETRWLHLLSDSAAVPVQAEAAGARSGGEDEMAALRAAVAALEARVSALEARETTAESS
jgi:uncharacterized protein YceH (UPF0502 family)